MNGSLPIYLDDILYANGPSDALAAAASDSPKRLSIDLPEHDIERANDRRDVCKHVAAAQEVHRL
jgi:hypothetical protein